MELLSPGEGISMNERISMSTDVSRMQQQLLLPSNGIAEAGMRMNEAGEGFADRRHNFIKSKNAESRIQQCAHRAFNCFGVLFLVLS